MINLMALHWGEINIKISITGVETASGRIDPAVKDGVLTPSTGRGNTKRVAGSGGSSGVIGRGSGHG